VTDVQVEVGRELDVDVARQGQVDAEVGADAAGPR
jgi:hypothetical protein